MSKLSIKITSGGKVVSQHNPTRVLADKQALVVIQAKAGQQFELIETETNKAPAKIFARRVGKDLHISMADCNEPDVIIGDFFNPTLSNLSLLGGESGVYKFEDASLSDFPSDACDVGMVLGAPPAVAAVGVLAPLAFGPLGVLAAGLGLAAAAGGGGGGGGDPAPDTTAPSGATGALDGASDSGTQGDNKTSNNKPTISGQTEPGAKVEVIINGKTYTTTAGADGKYSLPVLDTLPDGTYPVKIKATDAAGNSATFDGTPIVIDTTTSVAIANAGTGGTTSPISGTAEPGNVVTLKDVNGQVIGVATAGADGKWTVQPSSAVPVGVVTATAVDPAGNTAAAAQPNQAKDTTPPASATGALDAASDLGTKGDNKTSNNKPSISGVTEPGAKVEVTINGKTYTTTAGADGKYSLPVLDTLPDGTYPVTIKATDASGNSATFPGTPIVIDTQTNVAITNPGKAATTNPISGTTEAGNVVTLKDVNGQVIGTATAGADGKWTVTPTAAVAAGNITADAVDAAANKAASSQSNLIPVGAPTVTIPTDKNSDGFINKSETAANYSVNIGLPSDALVGDTLTVTNGSDVRTRQLTAADIAAKSLTESYTTPVDGTVKVDAFITNANQAKGATGTASVTFDTSDLAAGAKVEITSDTNNDAIVTLAELSGATELSAKVTLPAAAKAGDKLVITPSSGSAQTVTLTAADIAAGSYTAKMAIPANGATATVSVAISDAAGNTATVTDSAVINAQVLAAPVVTFTGDLDKNGVFNKDEAAVSYVAKITLPGAVAGDTLKITNGSDVKTITLTATDITAGYYNVIYSTPADGSDVQVKATITNAAKESSPEGSAAAKFDLSNLSGLTVTIATDVNNNQVIDATELKGGPISVNIVLPAGAAVGDTVLITPSTGQAVTHTLTQAEITAKAVVKTFTAPADGQNFSVKASMSDAAGNKSTAPDASDNAVLKTSATGAPTVTIVEDQNSDGWVSSSESTKSTYTAQVSFTGAVAGDVLNLTIDGVTQPPHILTAAEASTGAYLASVAKPAPGFQTTVVASITNSSNVAGPTAQASVKADGASTIGGTSTGAISEDATPATVSGQLTIVDVNSADLSFVAPAQMKGTYGTFTLEAATGKWVYTLNSSEVQSMKEGDTLTDSITVTSKDGTTSKVISVTINGVNDPAVIDGQKVASVTSSGVGATTTGTLTVSDVDKNQASFQAVADADLKKTYGDFTFEAATGKWTYTANPELTKALGKNETKQETLKVKSADGTEQTITVTVNGADDAAQITGTSTGTLTEDVAAPGNQTGGKITVTDPDPNESSVQPQTNVAGKYGTFNVLADGTWSYTLDNTKTATQELIKDQKEEDTLVVKSADGLTSITLTVQVTGANDVATITGDTTRTMTDTGAAASVEGTLGVADVDAGQAIFVAPAAASLVGQYGTFTFDAATGKWTYTANPELTKALGASDSKIETLTVTSKDGTSQEIKVTVNGKDDVATFSGDLTGAVTEDAAAPIQATGKITVTDPDSGQSGVKPQTNVAGQYGTFNMLADGTWTYELNNALPAVQALGLGKELTDTFTIKSADDNQSQEVKITINGANDLAQVALTSTTTGAVTDVAAAESRKASGAVNFTDIDAGESGATANNSIAGTYGSLSIASDGKWTYELDRSKAATRALGEGEKATEEIEVKSADGKTAQKITITVTGSNDVPTLNGTTTGEAQEDDSNKNEVSGTLTITDVDTGDNKFVAQTNVAGTYGTFSVTEAGVWTYKLDNSKAKTQELKFGESVPDKLTVSSKDGSASIEIVVTVKGTQDSAEIGGVLEASITEDSTEEISKAATITDVDAGQAVFEKPASLLGTYGEFTFNEANGAWTYKLDNTKTETQRLTAGQPVEDKLTIKSLDGTQTKDIVVKITGANDVPTISGNSTGEFSEEATNKVVGGTLVITDPDVNEATFQIPTDTEIQGVYGKFGFNANDGVWSYTLNNLAGSETQKLTGTDEKTDVLTIKSFDGTATQNITVTVKGVNDAASFADTSTTSGAVTEDTTYTATGTLAVNDVDNGQNKVVAQTDVPGTYGKFSVTEAGVWTYTLDNASAAVQALNTGEDKTETFTVTSKDGTASQVVTVTVKGQSDNATPVAVADTATAVEAGGVANGTAGTDAAGNVLTNDTDADAGDTKTVTAVRYGSLSFVDVAPNTTSANSVTLSGIYGEMTLGSDGSYKYVANKSAADALAAGESKTDTFTYRMQDAAGATSENTLTVTVNGVDDKSYFTGIISTGVMIEDGNFSGYGAAGTVEIDDVDNINAGFTVQLSSNLKLNRYSDNSGTYTTLDPNKVHTTFAAPELNIKDQSLIQYLAKDEELIETITFTALDGTQYVTNVKIVGVNDAASFAGTSTTSGAVTEDTTYTATGTLVVNDVDTGENKVVAQTDVPGTYGKFSVTEAGVWTYTLDNTSAAVQALNASDTKTETFTVTSKDGTASQVVTVNVVGKDELMAAVNLASIGTSAADGFVINGQSANDFSGLIVSNAGDVNGDGFDDLIVGAQYADPAGGSEAGKSYVVFGKSGTTAINLSAVEAGAGGFVINGQSAGDESGMSVSNAGDVNGDGLDDLIVGAWFADPAGGTLNSAGMNYVVFGKIGTTAVDLSALGSGGFVINGQSLGDSSGRSVSNAGDVNGDGIDDVIVGAAGADPAGGSDAGKSYVVFGKTGTSAIDLNAVAGGTGGFVINGQSTGDHSGLSVSNAGDVNGDGFDDLIVGAHNADPAGGSNAGKSYVVFGKSGTTAINLSAVEAGAGGFVINGQSAGDESGWSVSNAGDVNGDGFDDLIVGAPFADPAAGGNAGKSYVVFGKTGTTAIDLSAVEAGNGGFVINGQSFGDMSGLSVSNAGDVNGDGIDDVIVGAAGADPAGGSDAGKSYVVFGKTGTSAIDLNAVAGGTGGFVINGQSTGDQSGLSVSNAGDVNGDGFDDLIVGAPIADPAGGNNAGKSYVIFGGSYLNTTDGSNILASAIKGTTGNDAALNGTAGNDTIIADLGNDVATPGGGADKVFMGAGNDVVIAAQADINNLVARVSNFDGGEGLDVFRLSGSNASLNLTQISTSLDDFEVFDMGSSTAATITLNSSDVLALGERNITGTLGVAGAKHQMLIDGDSDDTVKLTDLSSWTKEAATVSFNGNTYDSYVNQNMQLLIEQGVQVTS